MLWSQPLSLGPAILGGRFSPRGTPRESTSAECCVYSPRPRSSASAMRLSLAAASSSSRGLLSRCRATPTFETALRFQAPAKSEQRGGRWRGLAGVPATASQSGANRIKTTLIWRTGTPDRARAAEPRSQGRGARRRAAARVCAATAGRGARSGGKGEASPEGSDGGAARHGPGTNVA